jgi:golgin subfamily B member 1
MDLLSLPQPLRDEDTVLYALLDAEASSSAAPEHWTALFDAAERDFRSVELGASFARIGQARKLKTYPAACIAEFFYRAGIFASARLSDEALSREYLERGLAALPSHVGAFDLLDDSLANAGEWRRLADVSWNVARGAGRERSAMLYRRAADCYAAVEQEPDRVEKALLEVLKLTPDDAEARQKLEEAYLRAGKVKDVAKLLEQSLVQASGLSENDALAVRGRLMQLYVVSLREPERALPHVERILALDPDHSEAREVAEGLLTNRGFASRAALLLAAASRTPGREEDLLRYLSVELEHTRGAKRRDLLKEIARLKEEAATDLRGALDTYEAALMLEPGDSEVRERYKALAISLGTSLDGARALIRIAPSVKDPSVRARLTVDTGELLMNAGDSKRARASLLSVLPMQGIDDVTLLQATELLLEIARSESDIKLRLDMLERLTGLASERSEALSLELAELASQNNEPGRAALAWKRLLQGQYRDDALIALEPLLEQTHNHEELVFVLEERAKSDNRDLSQVLLLKAAQVLIQKVHNEERAREVLRRCLERFGPDRDVLREYMPLLEGAYEWELLADAKAQDASLAASDEQAILYGALGLFHLQRTRKFEEAFQSFALALAADPNEAQSRDKLEGLLSSPEHRLRAAKLLEPVCRQGDSTALLVRVLEARGGSEVDPAERLAAFSEAAELAERMALPRWAELTALALKEAAQASLNLDYWVTQTDRALADAQAPARRRAETFEKALGSIMLSTSAHRRLATHAASAYEEAGDSASAVALLRRVLESEPSDEVLAKIDRLLGSAGNAAERVALYQDALTRAEPSKRPELLRSLASIMRSELDDKRGALVTYKEAYELEPEHPATLEAIEAILHASDRNALLAFYTTHFSKSLAESVHARAVRLRASLLALALGKTENALEHATCLLDASCTVGELDQLEPLERKAANHAFSKAFCDHHVRLSQTDEEQGLWRERRATSLAALSDIPAAAGDLRFVAALRSREGEFDKVRSLLRTIQRWMPEDLALQREVATLSAQLEDYPALTQELEALVARSSGDDFLADSLWLSRAYGEGAKDPARALEAVARAYAKRPDRRDVVDVFETCIAAHHEPSVVENTIELSETLGFSGEQLRRVEADRVALLMRAGAAPERVAKALHGALENPDVTTLEFASLREAFERFLCWESLGEKARKRERRYVRELVYGRLSDDADRIRHLLQFAREEEGEFALGLYERILRIDATEQDALREGARVAKELGKIEDALRMLEQLRKQAESHERVAFSVEIAALLLDHRSDAKAALTLLEEAAPVAPEHPAVAALLARMVAREDTAAAAVELLIRAADAAGEKGHADAELALLDLILETRVGQTAELTVRDATHRRRTERAFAMGDLNRELAATLAAAREFPGDLERWDRLEAIARELKQPEQVAATYADVVGAELPPGILAAVGPRAVEFQEEWFEDSKVKVALLQQIFAADPREPWAFERLKLIFDAEERWSDLFVLYDVAIEHSEAAERVALLEDVAHVAKDFAKDAERAIAYFEALLLLKPGTARVESTLERLYEKAGAMDRLVVLYCAQYERASGDAKYALAIQITKVQVESLGALADAMIVLDGVPESYPDARLPILLERLVAEAAPNLQALLAGVPTTVRHAAARKLATYYRANGSESDYARLREVELEVTVGASARAAIHLELRDLYGGLAVREAQFTHAASLLLAEPSKPDHVAFLTVLGEEHARNADVIALLLRVSELQSEPDEAARLWLAAAMVSKKDVANRAATMGLLHTLLARPLAPVRVRLEAANELVPLADEHQDPLEVLWALEMRAELISEPSEKREALVLAGEQASKTAQYVRSIDAWEGFLALAPDDVRALNELVDLYERTNNPQSLVRCLRARAAPLGESARADLVRAADVIANALKEPEEALKIWKSIEAKFGASVEGKLALAELYERTDQAKKAFSALNAGAKLAGDDTRFKILGRTGSLAWTALRDAEQAFSSFEAALIGDPREEISRGALLRMLEEGETRARALALLMDANTRTDDFAAQFALTETRFGASVTLDDKVNVLLDAARIAESRMGNSSEAFELTQRAFLLVPQRNTLQDELLRLGASANRTGECIFAIEEALRPDPKQDAGDAAWRLRLHALAGSLIEQERGEPRRALEHYIAIYANEVHSDECAAPVIRLAGIVGDWPVVAGAFLVAPNPARVGFVEDAAGRANAFDALADAVLKKLESEAAPVQARRTAYTCLAHWYRDKLERGHESERAFYKALESAPTDQILLEELSHVQRELGSPGFVATLVSLSHARGGVPSLLGEAAQVCAPEVREETLLLLENVGGESLHAGDASAEPYVEQALTGLLALYEANPQAAFETLLRVSALPLSIEKKRPLRLRAAQLADQDLDRVNQSVEILRDLLQSNAADSEVREALAALFAKRGMRAELVSLRRDQLSRAEDGREHVRVQLAEALFQMEKDEEGLAVLNDGLEESARSPELVHVLEKKLEALGKHAALDALWAHQGELAESAHETAAAVRFYRAATDLAEVRLLDLPRALRRMERAAELDPSVESLGNLARLASLAGEHSIAATQLERLRASIPPDSRPSLVVQLASALVEIGDAPTAILRLEESTAEAPDVLATREVLASLYRKVDDAQKLAPLLAETSSHYADQQKVIASLREASVLFVERCKQPERAVPLLEKALALAGDDRGLMLMLADAMGQAGDVEGAKGILGNALESFGGRKPKERAQVHYYIARLHLISGDRTSALSELETSTKIDPANAAALHALATNARADGKIEKAERAYRALLSVLRRPSGAEAALATRTEVLFALGEIAEAQGDMERAAEIRESAFEAAMESEHEADALERTLREAKKHEELSKLLAHRAARPDAKAPVHWSLAQLSMDMNNPVAAWPAAERALRTGSVSAANLALADSIAQALGKQDELLARLGEAVDARLAVADRDAAGIVLVFMGERALRAQDRDLARAHFARARQIGYRTPALLESLDLLHAEGADPTAHAEILRDRLKIAETESARRGLSLRLARLLGQSTDGVEEACDVIDSVLGDDQLDMLEHTLGDNPHGEDVQTVLRELVQEQPNSLRLARLYESQARSLGSTEDLTRALCTRFGQDPVDLDVATEAFETAGRISEARQSELLRRLRELAEAAPADVRSWVFKRSVEDATRRGALDDARKFSREVVNAEEGDARVSALLGLADDARARGDLDEASELYEEVLEEHASDERAWRPLLECYRQSGRNDRLADLLESVSGFDVGGDEVRAELLWERAEVLARAGRPDDVVELALLDVLEKSPGHAEAVARLVHAYEKSEAWDKLISLCRESASSARERGDLAAFGAISTRLATSLASQGRNEEALGVLHQALLDEPESRDLLRYAVSLQTDETPVLERLDLLERLVALESGPEAVVVAKTMAELAERSGDQERELIALERGVAVAPQDNDLRSKLEALYRTRGEWSKLAQILKQAHDLRPDDLVLLDSLLNVCIQAEDFDAVRGYRIRLAMAAATAGDPVAAFAQAEALLLLDPTDREALGLAAWCHSAAGRFDEALNTYEQLVTGASNEEIADLSTRYAEVAERAERLEVAVPALDRARQVSPTDMSVRAILLRAHEQAGRTLYAAAVSIELSELVDSSEEKFVYLVRAGTLLFDSGAEVHAAVAPLEAAYALKPTDLDVVALLADTYTTLGRTHDAGELLLSAIAAQKGRRSRELGTLHHRMARVAQADGDRMQEVQSLTTALDMDPQNGVAASELAELCLELGQLDLALRALRAVTMVKTESPMPKSVAYYRLGEIAVQQGDNKRAVMQLKRAIDEDPTLEAAHHLLAQIQPR